MKTEKKSVWEAKLKGTYIFRNCLVPDGQEIGIISL